MKKQIPLALTFFLLASSFRLGYAYSPYETQHEQESRGVSPENVAHGESAPAEMRADDIKQHVQNLNETTSNAPPALTPSSFAAGPMQAFTLATFDKTSEVPQAGANLVKNAEASFGTESKGVFQNLVQLTAEPQLNGPAISKAVTALNGVMHEKGLDFFAEVHGNKVEIITQEITEKKMVQVAGQSIPVYVVRVADGLNHVMVADGARTPGQNFGLVNATGIETRVAEMGMALEGNSGFALAQSKIPSEAARVPKTLDGIVVQSLADLSPQTIKGLLVQSTANHEAFHAFFESTTKGVNNPLLGSRTVREQGAYIHQLATSDPRIVKVVLTDILNNATSPHINPDQSGCLLALHSLQDQLPKTKVFNESLGGYLEMKFQSLPNLFNLSPKEIQAAATVASQQYMKEFSPR